MTLEEFNCICNKEKPVQNKILNQGLFVQILSCHFRQVFVHCLVYILMIYKSTGATFISSLWRIPLRCDLLRNRIGQKKFHFWQQLTKLPQLFCEIVFCLEFPDIPEKSWQDKETIVRQLRCDILWKQTQKLNVLAWLKMC